MEKLLGEARLKLIETATCNRLIHAPRGAKRSRTLPINGNASDQVFANLVRENRPLRFLATEEIAGIQREAAKLEMPRLVTPRTSHRNGLDIAVAGAFAQEEVWNKWPLVRGLLKNGRPMHGRGQTEEQFVKLMREQDINRQYLKTVEKPKFPKKA